MKRFLLLLAAVGLVSCSETLSAENKRLEEIQKRFDFSEVNTEGLEIKKVYEYKGDDSYDSDSFGYKHPDIAVAVGEINGCLWLGLFDREAGTLKYQYTDVDHPTSYSYSEYGVVYEYEYNSIGEIFGIYFEGNDLVLAIQYFIKESDKAARFDLISFDENKEEYRTTIFENITSYTSYLCCYDHRIDGNSILAIRQWSTNIIYLYDIYYTSTRSATFYAMTIYDLRKKEILCNHYNGNSTYLRYSLPDFMASLDPLHCWYISYSEKISIIEIRWGTATKTENDIELFDRYRGDDSRAPRYSYEYKIKTEDYALVVVTQTEYDGTVTTKTVEVRLENDELKVEVQ